MKQNFEQILRDSLIKHEVPYENGAWEKFQANTVVATPFYKSKWFVGGLIGILLLSTVIAINSTKPTDKTSLTKLSADSQLNTPVGETSSSAVNSFKEEMAQDIQEEVAPVNRQISSTKGDKAMVGETEPTPIRQAIPTEKATPKGINEIPSNTPRINQAIPVIPEKPTLVVTSEEMAKAQFFLRNETCQGSNIFLVSEENNPNHSYIWTINGTEIKKGVSIEYTATRAGINTVTLAVYSKNGGQLATKSSQILVNPAPTAEIEILKNKASLVNEFEIVNSNSYSDMQINFGDGTSSSINNKHTFKQAGIYPCTITLTSKEGCKTLVSEKIEVEGYYNFQRDFGFSPGDDNNINDYFVPQILREINVPFQMVIYSRNGQPVFNTNSVDQPWDGRLADGKLSSFESFVWVVTLTNEFGVKETYKGTITNVNN